MGSLGRDFAAMWLAVMAFNEEQEYVNVQGT
jgi:hypothetical protein